MKRSFGTTLAAARAGIFAGIFAATPAVLVGEGPARANDPAAAQTLFDQARALMARERWAEACPKLEESQRLDPGGGTLLHLALCRDHEGKIATAWADYRAALAVAKRDGRKDRIRIAQAQIDALEPRIAHLRIRVAQGNRSIAGFEVLRDQTPVGEAQWGEALPIDPGTRTIRARASGYKTWTAKVDVPSVSADLQLDVPELELDVPTREVGQLSVGTAAATPQSGASRPAQPPAADHGDGQRGLGLLAGGVGTVGVVIGSVFGGLAIAKHNEADRGCAPPARTFCSPPGVAAGHDSTHLGNVSTVAFSVGAAFILAGAILYFTADDKKPNGVAARFRPGGTSLGGLF